MVLSSCFLKMNSIETTALSTSENQSVMDLMKSPSKSVSELKTQLRLCDCLLDFKHKTFFLVNNQK